MSIMNVILEKIIHFFLCYGTSNITSKKGLPWLPIIKDLYLIHALPLKNLRYTQKVQFKDSNWRHANFVIWVAAILDLPKMGFQGVAKFEPHDFDTVSSLLIWYPS